MGSRGRGRAERRLQSRSARAIPGHVKLPSTGGRAVAYNGVQIGGSGLCLRWSLRRETTISIVDILTEAFGDDR